MKKHGFTLAEVLIAIAIIGIIAAMTMPTLLANHKKRVVVNRLQKFYSTMNQAVKLSEVENGETQYWEIPNELNADKMLTWYKKYLNDFLISREIEKTADGILVKNTDGSAFGMYQFMGIHVIYCVDYKSCKNYIKANNNKIIFNVFDGKNTFFFGFDSAKRSVLPYGSVIGLSRDELFNGKSGSSADAKSFGCAKTKKLYCSALIQLDGWQIKDDYPVKF